MRINAYNNGYCFHYRQGEGILNTSGLTSGDAAVDPQPAEHSAPHHEHGDRTAPAAPMPPQRSLIAAGELLRALAAPVRIAIVLQLRESERCVHELVDALGVTQPLISQHLRVLKAAGVVFGERSGREVLYRLVDDHLAHIVVDAVAHAEED
ncbi:metalloregulator ArsR/SmtB family transcription factor [Hoyosella sp. YIM 151337]|nr:metalloregulator ArsR/SmtB family transcription factor [Hoyosella sp. YIM 151337]